MEIKFGDRTIDLNHPTCCIADIAAIHSADIAVTLVEYWNPTGDFLRRFEVDILSVNDPRDAKRILKLQ